MSLARVPVVVSLLICLLSYHPTTVLTQTYIKYAVCSFCSVAFIAQGCPSNYDSLFCRLQAFKLNVLNCRTYPCINYDAPDQNICVESPLDCPIQHVKLFGMCNPRQLCCGIGGTTEDVRSSKGNSWQKLAIQGRQMQSLKEFLHSNKRNFLTAKEREKRAASASSKAENDIAGALPDGEQDMLDVQLEEMSLDLIHSAAVGEYEESLPENLDDPVVAEQTIMDEYQKLKQEVVVINQEEATNGGPGLIMPSFEHFRAVGLGERPIKSKTAPMA